MEFEGSLDSARQDVVRLRARSDEEDERWRNREQELLVRLEDSRNKERKLEDQKHNLEVCLADATQQIQELKVSCIILNNDISPRSVYESPKILVIPFSFLSVNILFRK